MSKTTLAILSCALLPALAVRLPAGEAAPKPNLYKERPVVLVPLVAEAPVVDGKLTDAVWAKAAVLPLSRLDGGDEKPKHATEAKVLSTKEALFVGVTCTDEMKNLKSSERERDGDVWQDDSVEIFLKAGESPDEPYHQIIVNVTGCLYDGYERDAAWNGKGIKTKVEKEEKAWVMEIVIPFADLKLPEKKEVLTGGWRFNIDRNRPARGEEELEEAAWSPTRATTSHAPDMFGYAFFEAFGGKVPEAVKAPEAPKPPETKP